jgi:hypothetical protein
LPAPPRAVSLGLSFLFHTSDQTMSEFANIAITALL